MASNIKTDVEALIADWSRTLPNSEINRQNSTLNPVNESLVQQATHRQEYLDFTDQAQRAQRTPNQQPALPYAQSTAEAAQIQSKAPVQPKDTQATPPISNFPPLSRTEEFLTRPQELNALRKMGRSGTLSLFGAPARSVMHRILPVAAEYKEMKILDFCLELAEKEHSHPGLLNIQQKQGVFSNASTLLAHLQETSSRDAALQRIEEIRDKLNIPPPDLHPHVDTMIRLFSSLENQGYSRDAILQHAFVRIAELPLSKDQKVAIVDWLFRLKILTDADATSRLTELGSKAPKRSVDNSQERMQNLTVNLVNTVCCNYFTRQQMVWGCFAMCYHPTDHGGIYTAEERMAALNNITGGNQGLTPEERAWIDHALSSNQPYQFLPREQQEQFKTHMLRLETIREFAVDLKVRDLSFLRESYLQEDLAGACDIWIAKLGLDEAQQQEILTDLERKRILSPIELGQIRMQRQLRGPRPWDELPKEVQTRAEQWLQIAARRKAEFGLNPNLSLQMSPRVRIIQNKISTANSGIRKEACSVWMQRLDLNVAQRKECLLALQGILKPEEINALAKEIPDGVFKPWDALSKEERSEKEKWLELNCPAKQKSQ